MPIPHRPERPPADGPGEKSTLFVVRVWPGEPGARISARAAADALPTWFDRPQAFLDFLLRRSADHPTDAVPSGSACGPDDEPPLSEPIPPKE